MITASSPSSLSPVLEEILTDKILHFVDGIPGFPYDHRFVMLQNPEERPFAWMRSLDHDTLTFIVVDAYAWNLDFSLEIDDEDLARLGSSDPREYAVYFILRVEETATGTCLKAQIQAPVLVNIRTREARQFVLPQSMLQDTPCLTL